MRSGPSPVCSPSPEGHNRPGGCPAYDFRAMKAWHSGDSNAVTRVFPRLQRETGSDCSVNVVVTVAERQQSLNRTKGMVYGHGIFNLQPKARDLIPRLSVTPTGYGESFPHHILAQIGRLKESLGAMLIAVENSPKSNG